MTMERTALIVRSWLPVVGLLLLSGRHADARVLSMDERIAAQRAIEQVYWSHRTWPKENPGPKPPLAAVMSEAGLRAKVEDYLKKSNALEIWWQRPVTAEQLQAELDRMGRTTRDASVLQELYGALGDDAFLIAETLARQTLVDRLSRSWYARDARMHGKLEAEARAQLAACATVACMSAMCGNYAETTWKLRGPGADAGGDGASDRSIRLDAEEWKDELGRVASKFGAAVDDLPLGRASALEETSEAFAVTAVRSRGEGELTIASVVWPKRSFDAWWSEERAKTPVAVAPDAASYDIARTPNGPCANDTWAITQDQPEGRYLHTAVWTGAEMIVWGGFGAGYSNSGGRYNPATDSWTPTSTGTNVPVGRNAHVAVWTGTEMLIWGGNTGTTPYSSAGGRYNPSTDSWAPTSTGANTPLGRYGHVGVWTGSKMVVWGGIAASGPYFNSGALYDPSTDSWAPTSIGANTPSPRIGATAVWSGTEMLVFGGRAGGPLYFDGARYDPSSDTWAAMAPPLPTLDYAPLGPAVWTGSEMIIWGGTGSAPGAGARYKPATDSWTQTSMGANTPSWRAGHTVVWTGTEMIVWGGIYASVLDTGGRYDPATNTWLPMSRGANTPDPRQSHTAVWTGTEMIVWGGTGSGGTNNYLSSGGRYKPSTNSWVPTHVTPGPASGRSMHTAVWTGTEMIVWGGRPTGGSVPMNTGLRYNLATNTWAPTSQGANVPAARSEHTAVWTGTEMIVWGGLSDRTGGRYNPTTDSWTPTSLGPNVPASQTGHTAVWTGTEMIIWGGWDGAIYTSLGGRYSPATNSWAATSTGDNLPAGRQSHTAVWTGTEMIVWGGWRNNVHLNTGGRYNPSSDTWAATSLGTGVPAPRRWASAVWTGAQMIVWGGYDGGSNGMNTGGRYDPLTDGWAPTSTGANVPTPRYYHTAVWTGAEMILWGGFDNTGGRYDPSGDAWLPTSVGANVPAPRGSHTAVWTGTQMIVWGGYAVYSVAPGVYCACPGGRIVYRDADGDGYGNPAVSAATCSGVIPAGYAAGNGDCNDASAAVHPGATETCNGVDDDCDAVVDDGGAGLCNDANNCTDDFCLGINGCFYVYNTAPCDNPSLCTYGGRCDTGSCVGTPGPPPEVHGVAATGHVTTILSWIGVPGGATYDVATSTLADLRFNTTASANCFANDVAVANVGDGRPAPDAGEGFYYIVRANNGCGTGSYGFATSGAERLPTAPCP